MTTMKEATFRVQEIHCGGCENSIRNSLSRLEGISSVEPDQATDEVRVAYDETRVKVEEIVERLADIGFPAAE